MWDYFEEEEESYEKHHPIFDIWYEDLSEDRSDEILNSFYFNLRQENGLLVDLDEFYFMSFKTMTFEGSEFLKMEMDGFLSGVDIPEYEVDRFRKKSVRWQIANKNLMFDLFNSFYTSLLDESGNLLEFDDFMYFFWKFTTLEGRDCLIETEQKILKSTEENGEKE